MYCGYKMRFKERENKFYVNNTHFLLQTKLLHASLPNRCILRSN